jgi:hypothetical protein
MEVQGFLKVKYATKQVSVNFVTREFVVEIREQYPQFIIMQLVQDKCDLIDEYAEGEEIIVSINLRGREWINPQRESKYFNSIQAWKIRRANSQPHGSAEEFKPPTPHAGEHFLNMNNNPKEFGEGNNEEEDTDLPF